MSEQRVVCVIDDDDAVRDSIRMLLECYGYSVRAYVSGAVLLRDGLPHGSGCLLIDANTPDMSGFDLLDELWRRGITTPAIVMTGGPTTRAPVSFQGIAASLQKPFRPGELIACIETVFGRRRA